MAKVLILSGAGLSAESGISTFRDSGGLWEEYDVSVVCNYDSLQKNEALTIEFYDKRRAELSSKEANRAHKVLAELKKNYGEDIAIITQNVDNLFEKAGLSNGEVIHLHGFMTELRCQSCEEVFEIGYEKQKNFHDGFCPSCSSKLRPNIVFFGEQAPLYEKLSQHINDCQLLVVLGTSGEVVGVNEMARYVGNSILNNLEPSNAIEDSLFSKVLYMRATEAIDEIAETIEEFLS
ncbi:MAG: NAD-dependent deacetylase [Helicobacteraceae bacterium]|nr:NAD-dependent deacetylase [Candidatus Sulfurimonas ponti]MBL6973460.1 NAD-dependent deacetylase [Sulfurimonas sp.]